jgi:hypothetical protein
MASDTIGAVDDFGIEYTDKKHAMHLIEALELHHEAILQRQARRTILRDHTGVGLHQTNRRPIHAWLHHPDPSQISTPNPPKTST